MATMRPRLDLLAQGKYRSGSLLIQIPALELLGLFTGKRGPVHLFGTPCFGPVARLLPGAPVVEPLPDPDEEHHAQQDHEHKEGQAEDSGSC
jgi:hypothetical protein